MKGEISLKAFLKGFLKGIIGCCAVVALGLAFCHFTGLLDWVRKDGSWEAVTADQRFVEESEEKDEANLQEADESREEQKEEQTAVISLEGESAGEEEASETSDVSQETICMLFAGDLYLTETLQSKYQKNGITEAASEELVNQLRAADLFVLNQEFPFGTTGEPMEEKQFTFRVHPQYISAELDLGVDLVTLANNHILDYGRSPLTETLETLNQAGIAYIGAGANLEEASACKTFSIGGKTIGFLGASRVIPVGSWNAGAGISGVFTTYDSTQLVEKIKAAKAECDYVIVYVHWGVERSTVPEDYQRQLGKAYIDAGADAVIGSHPHVVQGVEYYQGKPILYSLGNFIFNNQAYETMLAELTLEETDLKVRLIPCRSSNNQMSLMENTADFYSYVESLSFAVKILEDGTVRPE